MLKLIVGIKGTGKTKTLISMANEAVEKPNGSVVFLEKGTKLIHEIKYQVRLIDTDEYAITDAEYLFGFVAGIYASNHDVTDIFIDSALKICENDMDSFIKFIDMANTFVENKSINLVITSSIPVEEVPETLKKYID